MAPKSLQKMRIIQLMLFAGILHLKQQQELQLLQDNVTFICNTNLSVASIEGKLSYEIILSSRNLSKKHAFLVTFHMKKDLEVRGISAMWQNQTTGYM